MNRYEALKHAAKAHGAQLDKGGLLYLLHPIAVAERVAAHWGEIPNLGYYATLPNSRCGATPEAGGVVALLHDVLEDTDYVLEREWFTVAQWDALELVTHNKGSDTYFEYITHICTDPLACIVKLADLSHNMSPERAAALPEDVAHGLEKRYLKARERIWNALGFEWWPA